MPQNMNIDHKNKRRVLFICSHNSVRSQMAEAFLRNLYGAQYEAFSAGTEPTEINPYTIKVMEEAGIDISNQKAKPLVRFLGDNFDLVVTVCDRAKEVCPFFAGAKKTIHQGFPDPGEFSGSEEEILEKFRALRDQIRDWVIRRFG